MPTQPASPIAVIGLACRYPGARNPRQLWEIIIACRRQFRTFPSKRLPLKDYYDPDPQMADKTGDATYNEQWAKNDKASKLASQVADGKMIYFLDINKAFLNERGVLTRAVMPDLLHPGTKGYELWAAAMEPTIEKLMK